MRRFRNRRFLALICAFFVMIITSGVLLLRTIMPILKTPEKVSPENSPVIYKPPVVTAVTAAPDNTQENTRYEYPDWEEIKPTEIPTVMPEAAETTPQTEPEPVPTLPPASGNGEQDRDENGELLPLYKPKIAVAPEITEPEVIIIDLILICNKNYTFLLVLLPSGCAALTCKAQSIAAFAPHTLTAKSLRNNCISLNAD